MKTDKKIQAIELRKAGVSMRSIAAQLEVAKSSISLWTRDIPIPIHCRNKIGQNRTVQSYSNNGKLASASARKKRLIFQQTGINQARAAAENLFIIGCMLYWCEGHKSKNTIEFANSDPDLIVLFIKFLRSSLNVEDDAIKLRINVHLNNGLSQADIQNYWLNLTGLKNANLRKGTYNRYSKSSSRRKSNLIYGTVHLVVCSTEKLHTMYGVMAAMCGAESKFLF